MLLHRPPACDFAPAQYFERQIMINRIRRNNAINPGANASATVYDELGDGNGDAVNKAGVLVTALISQSYTIQSWWAPDLTSPLHLRLSTAVTADATHATRTLTCVAKAAIAAGGGTNDYFTCQGQSFEFKKDGSFVSGGAGRQVIDVTAATTSTDVAVIVAAALAAFFPLSAKLPTSLSIAVPGSAVITLVAAYSGTTSTITLTDNVADAGFTVGTLTAGTDGTLVITPVRLLPGRNVVTIALTTAAVEFSVGCETVDDVSSGGI